MFIGGLAALFIVSFWMLWHATSCSDAQEQQETLHNTNTGPIAGTPVLLNSLVFPSVFTPCRHGCHSTAHCYATWPVKKPCGLEQ